MGRWHERQPEIRCESGESKGFAERSVTTQCAILRVALETYYFIFNDLAKAPILSDYSHTTRAFLCMSRHTDTSAANHSCVNDSLRTCDRPNIWACRRCGFRKWFGCRSSSAGP